VYSEEIFLFGLPVISLKAAPEDPKICNGPDAISLRVESTVEKPLIPFRDGLENAMWFANFDGKLFDEDTGWQFDSSRFDSNSVSLKLSRSVSSRPDFTQYGIEPGASIYLRSTPEILPVRYGMCNKASLTTLFNIPKFECCANVDCSNQAPSPGPNTHCCSLENVCVPCIG
jgi:hypothetical protein